MLGTASELNPTGLVAEGTVGYPLMLCDGGQESPALRGT